MSVDWPPVSIALTLAADVDNLLVFHLIPTKFLIHGPIGPMRNEFAIANDVR